jgi:hypothetical protein
VLRLRQGALRLKKKNRATNRSDVPAPIYFLGTFFEIFRSDFGKYFYGVFELVMQRSGQKRDKKIEGKKCQEKFFFSTFWQKVFDMDFPHFFNGVFELLLLRNAQKCHKKVKINKNKGTAPTSFSGYLADIRRFYIFFLSAPWLRAACHTKKNLVTESFCVLLKKFFYCPCLNVSPGPTLFVV